MSLFHQDDRKPKRLQDETKAPCLSPRCAAVSTTFLTLGSQQWPVYCAMDARKIGSACRYAPTFTRRCLCRRSIFVGAAATCTSANPPDEPEPPYAPDDQAIQRSPGTPVGLGPPVPRMFTPSLDTELACRSPSTDVAALSHLPPPPPRPSWLPRSMGRCRSHQT